MMDHPIERAKLTADYKTPLAPPRPFMRAGLFHCVFDMRGALIDDRSWLQVEPQLLGQATDAVVSLATFLQFAARDGHTLAALLLEAAKNDVDAWHGDIEIGDANTAKRWLRISAAIAKIGSNGFFGVTGSIQDISAEKDFEYELRDLRHRVQGVLKVAHAAMFRVDLAASTADDPDSPKWNLHGDMQTMHTSRGTWIMNIDAVLGYPEGTFRTSDESFAALLPDDREQVMRLTEQTIVAGLPSFDTEFRCIAANGDMRWILASIAIERDATGLPLSLNGIQFDITERKLSEQRIEHMAGHDALTDLPNRALCNETLRRVLAASQRYGRGFAVMFIDLDRFKIINDTLGHDKGDILIVEMARRFRSVLRASEFVARLGGDEFVVLVEEIKESEQAEVVARKLLNAAIAPVVLDGHECRVTASIGICLYPRDGDSADTLMKNADVAMYQAKEEGKNNFQFYSAALRTQALERLALETHLREALGRNEFSLQYQPKIDLNTGVITGVEALLRWNNATLGQVSPTRFIPVAEDTGLIVPIGKWVLENACRQAALWHDAGLSTIPVAINVSSRQFADEDLYDTIVGALEQSGLPPELLEIELTESMVMHNIDRAVKILRDIKQLGVRIAIDDFGTGYSSLAQIRRFPIDTLKVDRSFVRNIQNDHEGQAITDAIIAMAKTLSLTVVAEGVETAAEADFLRGRECDQMQGYYFSKPIDSAAFAQLLSEYHEQI